LIILNSLIFLSTTISNELTESIYQATALNGYYVVLKGELYRLFSSMFLHSDMMHIMMNMLSLFMVGSMVERLFSTGAYLGIYFMSGLVGAFVSIYMHPVGWAVGASGAIFGIFGALAGFAFVHRQRMQAEFMSFMRSFGLVLVINFVLGIAMPSIDMSAHIGGLFAGIVGGFFIAKNVNNLWIYLAVSTLILVGVYTYLPSVYVSLVY
jgi:rhomboid protease GluP